MITDSTYYTLLTWNLDLNQTPVFSFFSLGIDIFQKIKNKASTWCHQLFILKSNVSDLEKRMIIVEVLFKRKDKNNEFYIWIFEELKLI